MFVRGDALVLDGRGKAGAIVNNYETFLIEISSCTRLISIVSRPITLFLLLVTDSIVTLYVVQLGPQQQFFLRVLGTVGR